MPLELNDIVAFLDVWDRKTENPKSVDNFTGPLQEVLQRPILDDQGSEVCCLQEVARLMVGVFDPKPCHSS